jgi:hypothetical protein
MTVLEGLNVRLICLNCKVREHGVDAFLSFRAQLGGRQGRRAHPASN